MKILMIKYGLQSILQDGEINTELTDVLETNKDGELLLFINKKEALDYAEKKLYKPLDNYRPIELYVDKTNSKKD